MLTVYKDYSRVAQLQHGRRKGRKGLKGMMTANWQKVKQISLPDYWRAGDNEAVK